jgi:cobalt-zinc-cadmium efflux system protein
MDGKHEHAHRHPARGRRSNRRSLVLVFGLTLTYMFAEAIGGFLTNSLALLSDAGHMMTDVAALALAMLALWFSTRPVTPQKTYGYYRTEILAALGNGVALVVVSLLIAYEAVQRIRQPEQVQGFEVMLIATGGLVINAISAWVLHSASVDNLNMRGAFLHVVSDALGSVGAIVAGVLIWLWGWLLADPIISVFMCLLILYGAWQLIRESVNVLLEGAPSHINVRAVIEAMHEVHGVSNVHDLHIWTIGSGNEALSAHVTIEQGASHTETLESLQDRLRSGFNIGHLTIQLESAAEPAPENIKLHQITRRSETEAHATSTGGSRQSATARNGKD